MSGIASPWGLTPPMVAGMNNSLDYGNSHLTGQLSLTSNPPKIKNNDFISPLDNSSYYNGGTISFGKKKKINTLNAEIKYLKCVKLSYLKRV